ncbi:MAG: ATP synthase F1 subunit gamma [Candidatus Sungbacteria bacterium]|nr:ATP synthase F1 subunit gamma [Candidatus Sungbacteria bacterium]
MQSTRDIKKRIRSVKNISQITKAMEVVSATKMRKSQEFAIRARPFATASLELLNNLLLRTETLPPFLIPRPVKKTAVLVVTSDKGLAGAFNANVLRKAEAHIAGINIPYTLVTVGKKARDHFFLRNISIDRSFWGFGDYTKIQDTLPVADYLLNGFSSVAWDELYAVYTNFRSTLRQETVVKKILPATREGLEDAVRGILPERGRFAEGVSGESKFAAGYNFEYAFEPSSAEILESLIPQILRMHLHHIILESNASEHSARMVAMKNASESAGELITDLSLVYNKTRQAGITRELTEITAGSTSTA